MRFNLKSYWPNLWNTSFPLLHPMITVYLPFPAQNSGQGNVLISRPEVGILTLGLMKLQS